MRSAELRISEASNLRAFFGVEPQTKKRRVEEANGVSETPDNDADVQMESEAGGDSGTVGDAKVDGAADGEAGAEATTSDAVEEVVKEEEKFVEYVESEDETEALTEESVKKLLGGVNHAALLELAESLALSNLDSPELLALAKVTVFKEARLNF